MNHISKGKRRSLEAQLRYFFTTKKRRAKIDETLRLFTPYTTNVPLVRIGSAADGGYLVPDDLENLAASFSPGVSAQIGFDKAIMNLGIRCFLADASVDDMPEHHPLATFEKLFLGPRTEGRFISLDDWVEKHAGSSGDLLLQMDIEGAEYDTILAASDETLAKFRIMLIELHGLHKVFETGFLQRKLAPFLERLTRNFTVVHLHLNNASAPVVAGKKTIPPLLEISLLRNDRISRKVQTDELPHDLDQPNVAHHEDYKIPFFWKL